MRTNLVLDDALLERARRYSRARTKKGVVEEALRTFVEVRSSEERCRSYERRLYALAARLENVRLSEVPSMLLRADRERA